jgi:hypothetical protein
MTRQGHELPVLIVCAFFSFAGWILERVELHHTITRLISKAHWSLLAKKGKLYVPG